MWQHLEATGAEWYSVAESFTNRSNQLGNDMKDEVRTEDDWHAWRISRPPGTAYGGYVTALRLDAVAFIVGGLTAYPSGVSHLLGWQSSMGHRMHELGTK